MSLDIVTQGVSLAKSEPDSDEKEVTSKPGAFECVVDSGECVVAANGAHGTSERDCTRTCAKLNATDAFLLKTQTFVNTMVAHHKKESPFYMDVTIITKEFRSKKTTWKVSHAKRGETTSYEFSYMNAHGNSFWFTMEVSDKNVVCSLHDFFLNLGDKSALAPLVPDDFLGFMHAIVLGFSHVDETEITINGSDGHEMYLDIQDAHGGVHKVEFMTFPFLTMTRGVSFYENKGFKIDGLDVNSVRFKDTLKTLREMKMTDAVKQMDIEEAYQKTSKSKKTLQDVIEFVVGMTNKTTYEECVKNIRDVVFRKPKKHELKGWFDVSHAIKQVQLFITKTLFKTTATAPIQFKKHIKILKNDNVHTCYYIGNLEYSFAKKFVFEQQRERVFEDGHVEIQHVGYVKMIFCTIGDAVIYYETFNEHMTQSVRNVDGVYRSDFDPDTHMRYVLRAYTGEELTVARFKR
jgi:hypothetical protein